jgi:hypothetical protein
MASSQMIVSMTVADLEMLMQRAVSAALSGKTMPSVPSASSASSEKPKKAKKEKDPSAPKKEPNDWIKFTSSVRAALKAADIKTGVEVTQFCGMLKAKNADYASWTSELILAEHSSWERPEVSKQALAGKNKSPVASPSTAAAPAPADEKKPKAKKAEVPAPSPPAAAEEDEDEEDPLTKFVPWTFKKASYLKNGRGDVISEEFDWIGRFDEKAGKIDRSFPQPADLETE